MSFDKKESKLEADKSVLERTVSSSKTIEEGVVS